MADKNIYYNHHSLRNLAELSSRWNSDTQRWGFQGLHWGLLKRVSPFRENRTSRQRWCLKSTWLQRSLQVRHIPLKIPCIIHSWFHFCVFPCLFRHQSEKKIRTLPEIDGLSKDTVVTSWMAKYDALMKGKTTVYIFIKMLQKLIVSGIEDSWVII